MHNLPLVHKVAVVNEKGNVCGYLRVCIEPILSNENNLLNDNTKLNKKVRQSARLNFRREDFLKRYQQRTQTSRSGRCINLDSPSEAPKLFTENSKHFVLFNIKIVCSKKYCFFFNLKILTILR